MKAITYYQYGSVDNLKLEEVEKPAPKDNEVLIKMQAASINSWDWDLVQGAPFYVRLAGGGIRNPIKKIIGCDIAGIVEGVGKKVTKFQPGDEVFGDISQCGWGGFAEFVCAKENALTVKPSFITFEEAAATPQAGVMALQGIRDFKKIEAGVKMLVNGAGGGVGTFAIQMAKLYGAEVTGVDNSSKLSMMTSLGADHVIDFVEEDFTQKRNAYDYILDVVGHHSIYDYKRSLRRGGEYRMIGGPTSLILQAMMVAPFISMTGNKKMGILGHEPNKGLGDILELYRDRSIKPVIDSVYSLEDTVEAFRYFGRGLFKGKVVISM